MNLDKIKNFSQTVGAVAAVVILSWGVVTQAGWVITRADAKTMITVAVQESASQAAQAILDEAKARERADLLFQKNLLVDKIVELMALPKRTASEEYQLQQMKGDVDRIAARLDALP